MTIATGLLCGLTLPAGSFAGTSFGNYPPEQTYSLALHVHGSMSEMHGSMEWHTAKAESIGVDVIWWTDHDWRLRNTRFMKRFDFESATWNGAFLRWEEPDDAWSINVRYFDTDPQSAALVQTSLSDTLRYEGARSLRMEAVGPAGAQFASGYLHQTTMMFNNRYSLAKRVQLSFALHPELLDPANARFVLEVELSDHPDGTRLLRYVAGSMDGEGPHSIPLSYTLGAWNTYVLDVTADAIAHFSTGGADTLRAEDNSLGEVRIGLETRNGSALRVHLDDYRLDADPSLVGDVLLNRARAIGDYYQILYPGVSHYAGSEISHFLAQPHLNAFAPNFQLVDYTGHVWSDSIHYAVQQIQAQGGAVSLNHVYGPRFTYQDDPDETPEELAVRHLWVKQSQIGIRAYGVDMLEVGYRLRGGAQLWHHLDLWDALNANAIWITGNGVTDSHGRGEHGLIGWGPAGGTATVNNFVTWLHTEERSEAGFVQAMKRGRAYFGDPYLWQGELDLRTTSGFRMGQVVVTDQNTDELTIEVTNVPAGVRVRLLQIEIREDPLEDYAVVNVLRDEILGDPGTGSTFLDTVTVDTTIPSFFRIEVADSTGEGFVYGNPICFVKSVPQRGVPPWRAAALSGGVRLSLAESFTLRDVSFDASTQTITITGDEEPAGSGSLLLDPGLLGAPLGVTGAANWSYSPGALQLSGFDGAGSIVRVTWTETGAGELTGRTSSGFRLGPGRPNPFGDGTVADYSLPLCGSARLTVHDVSGRRIRTLADGAHEAGMHRARWDGRDESGRRVADGVYTLRLRFGDRTAFRKIVKIGR